MPNIAIGGEVISVSDAKKLIELLQKQAKEFAGLAHTKNRSKKFRANWPSEYDYAETQWKTYMAAARAYFSQRLADPKTEPKAARGMFLALLLERAWSEGQKQLGAEADDRLQLAPGTQQFEGDSYENRQIVEKFGVGRNLRAALMDGASKINSIH